MKKKILVISNNVFSEKKNNGKTLFSFFNEYDNNDISQLYFSEEDTEIDTVEYFKLSDKMILNKRNLSKKVNENSNVNIVQNSKNLSEFQMKIKSMIIKSNLIRLLREVIWRKSNWYEDELNEWIKDRSPNLIFFCAGDSGFAYDIVKKISKQHNLKVLTYITDDYLLNRSTLNVFWHIRKNYILKKFKEHIKISNHFFTISPKMSYTYKKLFKIESDVLSNISSEGIKTPVSKSHIPNTLIYAGGLHYGRDKIIIKLSNAIEKVNEGKSKKNQIKFDVYSHQEVSKKFVRTLKKNNHTNFLGEIEKSKLEIKLQEDVIPVHVESFKRRHKDATKLSLSTKIPEYLSLGKPILAIGPSDISSMEYLSETSYCIYDTNDIKEELNELFLDLSEYNKKSYLSKKLFEKNHDRQKTLTALNELFDRI